MVNPRDMLRKALQEWRILEGLRRSFRVGDAVQRSPSSVSRLAFKRSSALRVSGDGICV